MHPTTAPLSPAQRSTLAGPELTDLPADCPEVLTPEQQEITADLAEELSDLSAVQAEDDFADEL